MNYICHGFLDAVSEEAEILFPPSSRGKPGKENFNVQRFAKGALAGDPKRWRTLRESPSLLRLDEAQAMADTLHRPLVELIVKAQDKARKYQTDQNFFGEQWVELYPITGQRNGDGIPRACLHVVKNCFGQRPKKFYPGK